MTHEVWCNNYSEIYHKLPAEFTSDRILKIGQYLVGTCKASKFDLNRTSRFDSKGRADSKISNRRACHVCRRTTHCSTTNFSRFGIATGIYIEFN